MKQILHNSFRSLFLSLAVLLSLPMLAEKVEIDGINYELVAKAKQATVIAKSSGEYSGEVVIPASVEHEGTAYSVTSIGEKAFRSCDGLTSVTIGNSVTSIGSEAFEYCRGLTSVTIPNSVMSIGRSAFGDCSGLTSVTIPNSVTSIGDGAFFRCSGLTSIVVENGNTVYDSRNNCNALIETASNTLINGCNTTVIPNSVTSIGNYAFLGCSGLTSVTIPNSVTSIGEWTFKDCSGLTSVTIPNSVTSIGDYTFQNCSGLTSVTIPNSVTSIGEEAFRGCSGLTSVTIGRRVEEISSGAFAYCPELLDVYCYAEKAPTANSNIFYGSYSKNATLYVHPTSIGYYMKRTPWSSFRDIVALPTEVDGINYDFSAETKQATVIAKSSGTYSGEIVIPESVEYGGVSYSVTSIGEKAFYCCDGLTSVTIGNSVTSIGRDAFTCCFGLTSVNIPNSVESIGWVAFYRCSGLTSVTIGNGVTSIGAEAFSHCSSLTSVTIGNNVTSIWREAFFHCDGLTSVTIPNSVESIGNGAFCDCSGLTSVTIGSGVKEIYSMAFANCLELLDVYCYAEKVPSTESNAFKGSYPEYVNLHVPDGSVGSYKAKEPWSKFGKIVGLSGEEPEEPEEPDVPEVEKCATPVVSYADGKLSLACETEGVEFMTKIRTEDAKDYYDVEIELSATYNIEVYATKANYENSDTVSVALVWVENGEVNNETGVISVPVTPVLIQGNGGVLNISGIAKDTEIVVYTISGTEVVRATAAEGTTSISTGLQSGTVVIIMFGTKSVKVRI